jgi:hypothetical protein
VTSAHALAPPGIGSWRIRKKEERDNRRRSQVHLEEISFYEFSSISNSRLKSVVSSGCHEMCLYLHSHCAGAEVSGRSDGDPAISGTKIVDNISGSDLR